MKHIYAIRDRVANDLVGYYPLVVMRTDSQAVRYFGDSLAQEKSALGAHPNDYELIRCGAIDDDGTIQQLHTPQIVITGAALVAASTPQMIGERHDGDDDADIDTGRKLNRKL